MSLAPNIVSIVNKLSSKTVSDEAAWRKLDDQAFRINLTRSTITIIKYVDAGAHKIAIEIKNSVGDTIYLKAETTTDSHYALLLKLHDAVHESVYRTNETLDGVLSELEGDGVVGGNRSHEIDHDDIPF